MSKDVKMKECLAVSQSKVKTEALRDDDSEEDVTSSASPPRRSQRRYRICKT